jgi:hypothetical protein
MFFAKVAAIVAAHSLLILFFSPDTLERSRPKFVLKIRTGKLRRKVYKIYATLTGPN